MTRATTLPVLKPVELAACSSGRVGDVVLSGDEVSGADRSPSVVVGRWSRPAVVAVLTRVVLGMTFRAVVDGEAEAFGAVVVGRGRALVVGDAAVVELGGEVVLGDGATVVEGVDGRVMSWPAAGTAESAPSGRTNPIITPTTNAARCRSPTKGMVGGRSYLW